MGSGISMFNKGAERRPRYLLLSVHPKYIKMILDGRKYYEFRKKFPLHADKFVFYATSPVKKIVAIAERTHLLVGDLEYLWQMSEDVAGISREEFEKYFEGKTHGTAVGLTGIKPLQDGMSLSELDIKTAPQMYMYLDEEQWKRVEMCVVRAEWPCV